MFFFNKYLQISETLDTVKQSAALCLLKLLRTNPEIMPTGEWTTRIIHLLNDQHLVRKLINRVFPLILSVFFQNNLKSAIFITVK